MTRNHSHLPALVLHRTSAYLRGKHFTLGTGKHFSISPKQNILFQHREPQGSRFSACCPCTHGQPMTTDRTAWNKHKTRFKPLHVWQWSLTAEPFYVLENVDCLAEVKNNLNLWHNWFQSLKSLWAGAEQEQGSHTWSAQGSVQSSLLHNSDPWMPKETQACESCSTCLQEGRLVMPAYHKSQKYWSEL